MKKTSTEVRIKNLEAQVSFLTAKLESFQKFFDPADDDSGFLAEGEEVNFFSDWLDRDPFAEFLSGIPDAPAETPKEEWPGPTEEEWKEIMRRDDEK